MRRLNRRAEVNTNRYIYVTPRHDPQRKIVTQIVIELRLLLDFEMRKI